MLVERNGYRTFPVRHVNVDTVFVTTAPVPDSLEALVLRAPAWNLGDVWAKLAPGATQRSLGVESRRDVNLVSVVRAPVYASRQGGPTLSAVRVTYAADSNVKSRSRAAPIALLQTTDLGITARVGQEEALVWVTGVQDGIPKSSVDVELHDPTGRVRARGTTNAQGLVRLAGLRDTSEDGDYVERGFAGYVSARLALDRAVVAINSWSGDLSPWRFNIGSASGADRLPVAAAVFTERGIYRPGEPVLPWVYAIARRVGIDGYRRTKRITSHESAMDVLPEQPAQAETRNTLPEFDTLVAALPEAQREVITMMKVGGLSLEEVARATSCTVGAVKQKAHRAYERLRKLLETQSAEGWKGGSDELR